MFLGVSVLSTYQLCITFSTFCFLFNQPFHLSSKERVNGETSTSTTYCSIQGTSISIIWPGVLELTILWTWKSWNLFGGTTKMNFTFCPGFKCGANMGCN